MTGHTSHNDPTRQSRRRRLLLSLTAGVAFAAALGLAVATFPDTEVGRTLHSHLGQLADPRSWIP